MFKAFNLTLVIALLSLLAQQPLTAKHGNGDSEKYTSEVCKVQIIFPGEYEEKKESNETGDTYNVMHNDDKTTYQLSTVIHNTDMSMVASSGIDINQVSIEGFAEAVKGEVLSTDKWDADGEDGAKATIRMPAGDNFYTVNYAVVLVGQYQYQLVVFSPEEENNEKGIKKFFSSFKIL